jgi:hypothetical protein
MVVRSKNMMGYCSPYIPGWDNHGMTIESAIIKKNKLDRKKMSIPEFRNKCREFAGEFVDKQREQFIRLGVLGNWENPYLTMDPSFEKEEVKVFGEMYRKGYIYKASSRFTGARTTRRRLPKRRSSTMTTRLSQFMLSSASLTILGNSQAFAISVSFTLSYGRRQPGLCPETWLSPCTRARSMLSQEYPPVKPI